MRIIGQNKVACRESASQVAQKSVIFGKQEELEQEILLNMQFPAAAGLSISIYCLTVRHTHCGLFGAIISCSKTFPAFYHVSVWLVVYLKDILVIAQSKPNNRMIDYISHILIFACYLGFFAYVYQARNPYLGPLHIPLILSLIKHPNANTHV